VIDVDGQGAGGWTPLGLAVRVNNTAVVDVLLAKGAWAEQKMKTGKSPLDIARINNRVAIIEAIERSAKRS
jgi:ankyrin repeat protein